MTKKNKVFKENKDKPIILHLFLRICNGKTIEQKCAMLFYELQMIYVSPPSAIGIAHSRCDWLTVVPLQTGTCNDVSAGRW